MWLECIGVVSGCGVRRYVYRFHHITYPYSTCINSFLQPDPYFDHFKMFFHSCLLFLCHIANVAPTTFEIIQKSRSR